MMTAYSHAGVVDVRFERVPSNDRLRRRWRHDHHQAQRFAAVYFMALAGGTVRNAKYLAPSSVSDSNGRPG